MPLQIRISIDHMPIVEVKVTRLDTFTGNDKTYKYLVRHKDERYTITHNYSDGAVKLAEKALNSIAYNYIPPNDDSPDIITVVDHRER